MSAFLRSEIFLIDIAEVIVDASRKVVPTFLDLFDGQVVGPV